MVSCLEQYSVPERNREMARSDYNENNRYSASHPDALANGDRQGKGTGHGGHSHWLPHCTSTRNVFDYSNFDTDPNSGMGNDLDNNARNAAFARTKYKTTNVYSANIIDTTGDTLYMSTVSSNVRGASGIGG